MFTGVSTGLSRVREGNMSRDFVYMFTGLSGCLTAQACPGGSRLFLKRTMVIARTTLPPFKFLRLVLTGRSTATKDDLADESTIQNS
ncbi:hypothetical protein RRG08_043656 [Elysia crispata]|uniref:Uncharacterized protein n=1 Tax=Elysia crispata TaxID=231223 RepID=A0AAE0ZVV6_9GAST|nr:hypothetical protein RRG08_043656 [Elysia crispata]